MAEQLFDLFSRINSLELQDWLFWIKAPMIFMAVLFVVIIITAIIRTPYLQLSNFGTAVEFITYRPYGMPKMRRRWRRITRRLDAGNESEYKLAIIEADALLDEMLKKMNLKGDTVDERLAKVTPLMIPNLEDLQSAHAIRNNIVYDPDYRIGLMEARRVMGIYELTFQNLDLFR
jgi:hypothetical protein